MSIVGDNVNFNDALARVLGIDRGKCLVHASALMIKYALAAFPDTIEAVVRSLGTVIFGGGGSRRPHFFKSRDVPPNGFRSYDNRLGSRVDVANFVIKHWGLCSEFVLGEELTKMTTGDEDDDDDSREREPKSQRAKHVIAAWKNPTTLAFLHALVEVTKTPHFLITALSGDCAELPSDVGSRLKKLEQKLKLFSTREGAKVVCFVFMQRSAGLCENN